MRRPVGRRITSNNHRQNIIQAELAVERAFQSAHARCQQQRPGALSRKPPFAQACKYMLPGVLCFARLLERRAQRGDAGALLFGLQGAQNFFGPLALNCQTLVNVHQQARNINA